MRLDALLERSHIVLFSIYLSLLLNFQLTGLFTPELPLSSIDPLLCLTAGVIQSGNNSLISFK